MGFERLNIDEVLEKAQHENIRSFSLLSGNIYHVVDVKNRTFSMEGDSAILTYDNITSWYSKNKVFFVTD